MFEIVIFEFFFSFSRLFDVRDVGNVILRLCNSFDRKNKIRPEVTP